MAKKTVSCSGGGIQNAGAVDFGWLAAFATAVGDTRPPAHAKTRKLMMSTLRLSRQEFDRRAEMWVAAGTLNKLKWGNRVYYWPAK